MADSDDWDLSAEDLDFLEKDAIRKISEKKTCSSSLPPRNPKFEQFPPATPLDSRHGKVEAASPSASHTFGETDNNTADLPKLSVRLYLHSTGAIAAKFPYHPSLVDACHKIPRASWHGKERLWMFPVSSLPMAEEAFSGVAGANVEVQKLDSLVQRALTAASAVPDLTSLHDRMPSYIESKLLPFQREGVRFILQHGGRVLLADEMGLGKTLQAIAVSVCLRDFWPVLIITPSSLRLHWASMIQQWLNIPSEDILVVLSSGGGTNRGGFKIIFSNTKASIELDGAFNIISYDTVPKFQNMLLASGFKVGFGTAYHDCCCLFFENQCQMLFGNSSWPNARIAQVDRERLMIKEEDNDLEEHLREVWNRFLYDPTPCRTLLITCPIQQAQFAILLSGTPALSRPIELHKQLEALYPAVYKNVHDYGNRYCKGGIFGLYQGASNHEELHCLMKATVMIRRLKQDVLSELPVKRRQQVFLDLNEKDTKQIRALFRELEVVKSNMKACESNEEIESLKRIQKSLITKIYTDSAVAKIPAVLDYLGTVIEAGCKFLVFAHHQPMIEAIHKFLLKKKIGCIRIDGGTPSTSRQTLVNDFQEKDDIKAAVLSIKAAGVGLTLTAASTVIFTELTWTPGDIIQAEDRAHRIGQVASVNVYYLLAYDTADDIMWDVLQNKLDNLGQVLDGEQHKLEVNNSQSSSSQGKQTLTSSSPGKQSLTSSSPGKQKTLDSFLKRCSRASDPPTMAQKRKL